MGHLPAQPLDPIRTGARDGGFTLVELLVTMAIAGILLAIGVPSLQSFLADQAAAASADELAEGIRLARTEATKRGISVTICASQNTSNATPTCSQVGDDGWLTGWIIQDSAGNLIRVQNPMRSISTVASNSQAQIDFLANGMTPTGAVTFVLTPVGDSNSQRLRNVAVNAQGRVKITKGGV